MSDSLFVDDQAGVSTSDFTIVSDERLPAVRTVDVVSASDVNDAIYDPSGLDTYAVPSYGEDPNVTTDSLFQMDPRTSDLGGTATADVVIGDLLDWIRP